MTEGVINKTFRYLICVIPYFMLVISSIQVDIKPKLSLLKANTRNFYLKTYNITKIGILRLDMLVTDRYTES